MFSNWQEEDKILEKCEFILFQRKQARKNQDYQKENIFAKKLLKKLQKRNFLKFAKNF